MIPHGLLGALLLLSCASTVACDKLTADAAWLRQPPPGANMAAGYFALTNAGHQAVTVIGVRSPEFGSAMLHETRYDEGRATMRHLDAVTLEPGQRFVAEPGGAHVMLGDSAHALDLGDIVELVVDCDNGTSLSLWLPVRRSPP